MKLAVACVAVAILGSSVASELASAQAPAKDELLRRTADYVARFVDGLTNVVADEEYQQAFDASAPRRRFKSDFLLVKYPGQETEFLAFRDVIEVNGRPVSDQQDRLLKLFVEPFANPLRRASEIANESSRHSLDRARLANPLFVIALLQGHYQPNFRVDVNGRETRLGPDVREIELFQDVGPSGGTSQGVRAAAWIEETTGRVVKTELRMGRAPNMALTTTTFGHDRALGIDVPLEMRDSYPARGGGSQQDQFVGTARYTRFRRFQVHVEETIDVPPTPK
jgi:hypothetical protein